MTHVYHVNLHDRRSWRNERHEIPARAAARFAHALRNALELGRTVIDGGFADGFWIEVVRSGRCCAVRVFAPDGATLLATLGIATHSRCGAGLWRALHDGRPGLFGDPERQPAVPWCARRDEQLHYPGVVHPIEQGIAWAFVDWIESRPAR